jgi:hypothetical protein
MAKNGRRLQLLANLLESLRDFPEFSDEQGGLLVVHGARAYLLEAGMTSSFKLCTTGRERCQPETLREALYCQVHHSALRLEALAGELGISPSALSDAVNPHGDGSMLAAKHHERVLALTPDNTAVMAFYARTRGEVVIKLPAAGAQVDAATAAVVREFGEFLTTHATARGDRVVTRHEAAQIALEGNEAIQAIVSIIEDARREAEKGGRP